MHKSESKKFMSKSTKMKNNNTGKVYTRQSREIILYRGLAKIYHGLWQVIIQKFELMVLSSQSGTSYSFSNLIIISSHREKWKNHLIISFLVNFGNKKIFIQDIQYSKRFCMACFSTPAFVSVPLN